MKSFGPGATVSSPSPLLENFDLHNHSNASDGLLPPAELVRLAHQGKCDAIALTDHDTTSGLEEAATMANLLGMRFIPGIEISVSWRPASLNATLHIVGLRIDRQNKILQDGLRALREGRWGRARQIGADLERAGIHGAFEGACANAENKEMIGRTHFARHLVEAGVAKSIANVFERYLAKGKPGYVAHNWATLADAISWIRHAGGVAVLAHPGRYKMTEESMRELIEEFRSLGGEAIEVVTGSHQSRHFRQYAALAKEFKLLASRGADFHGLDESYYKPGTLPSLPAGLTPVWTVL